MRFGLIGHPINHSQSPALFAAAYPGGEHSYELIEEPDFDKAYARFLEGYDAVNVTTPFKERLPLPPMSPTMWLRPAALRIC